MNGPPASRLSPWQLAVQVAALSAVTGGGVWLRALPGPVRDHWLELLRSYLPAGAPWRKIPAHITTARLIGGLDLAATLQAGRPMAEQGVLTAADGGIALLCMAERLTPEAAGIMVAALDRGEVLLERDGLSQRLTARFQVIAQDEGSEDEAPPPALTERLWFCLDFSSIDIRALRSEAPTPTQVVAARARLAQIAVAPSASEALCRAALELGIESMRPVLAALRVARGAAALAGRTEVSEADTKLAAGLVLAPRALLAPEPADDTTAETPPEVQPDNDGEATSETPGETLEDRVVAAAAAAIPEELLRRLAAGLAPRGAARRAGRAGAWIRTHGRGRPLAVRAAAPHAGARLALIETLRAASPWQPLRRAQRALAIPDNRPAVSRARLEIRPSDLRIVNYKQRTTTTTIFVVDASGSAAANRLGEAKGAIELMLADCYIRRDKVALLAFRGRSAELLLEPTRSLVRAKRSLARLPGGGGTPLAAAIDAAAALAVGVTRSGDTVRIIVLTDGRANVTLEGLGGNEQAMVDARAAAARFKASALDAVLIDVAPRTRPFTAELARDMGARYLPLPFATAHSIAAAVGVVQRSQPELTHVRARSTTRPVLAR